MDAASSPASQDWASHLTPDGLAIFLFHGVIEQQVSRLRNYTRKHLPKDDFAGVLRQLTASGTAISMDEVVDCHRTGRAYPPRAFCITFDDGFENNLSVAAPILDDFHLPATFYITTGFIEHNWMSWIDRIEWAVEAVPTATLSLPWRAEPLTVCDDDAKRSLLDEIRREVKSRGTIDPDELASQLQRQSGLAEIRALDGPLDAKLDWDGVTRLAGHPSFIVGGHSHRHRILSHLGDGALRREIEDSLRLLRDKAGLTVSHYSYPEGMSHCYDERVIGLLRQHGIVCSPSAEPGVNAPGADLFHLKRISVAPGNRVGRYSLPT